MCIFHTQLAYNYLSYEVLKTPLNVIWGWDWLTCQDHRPGCSHDAVKIAQFYLLINKIT